MARASSCYALSYWHRHDVALAILIAGIVEIFLSDNRLKAEIETVACFDRCFRLVVDVSVVLSDDMGMVTSVGSGLHYRLDGGVNAALIGGVEMEISVVSVLRYRHGDGDVAVFDVSHPSRPSRHLQLPELELVGGLDHS